MKRNDVCLLSVLIFANLTISGCLLSETSRQNAQAGANEVCSMDCEMSDVVHSSLSQQVVSVYNQLEQQFSGAPSGFQDSSPDRESGVIKVVSRVLYALVSTQSE